MNLKVEEDPFFQTEDKESKSEIDDEDSDDDGASWIIINEEDEDNPDVSVETTTIFEETRPAILLSSESGVEEVTENTDSSFPLKDLSEELPDQYAQIQKGTTYVHNRNRELNLFLSGSVILSFAIVFGFGCGHFLGWSERLEKYDFPESTVNPSMECESFSIEDLQRLRLENKELKDEIESTDALYDRIQELLSANSNLEQQIAALRVISESKTQDDLKYTKETFNDVVNENELLKIAIGKARYGKPSMPIEDKERLNELVIENEELKQEVRRMRYGAPPNPLPPDVVFPCNEESSDKSEQGQIPKDKSKYIHYLKEYILNSTQTLLETSLAFQTVKAKVTEEVAPLWQNLESNLYNHWDQVVSFAQKKNVKSKVYHSTKKVIKGMGKLFYSAFKIIGETVFSEDDPNPNLKKEDNRDKNWFLKRSQKRREIRKEQRRSDWLFDRAHEREKSHDTQDWYNRRLFGGYCGEQCEHNNEYRKKTHKYKKNKYYNKKEKFPR